MAAQRAAHLNPGIQLLAGNRAATQLSDGSWLKIANSSTGVQMFWGCEGCTGGLQHYRLCTPHTLSKALALRCTFCSYAREEWEAEGRQQLWDSELRLMQELIRAGLSDQWCHQVVPGFQSSAVDFMHTSKKAIMQADGSAHFKETFGASFRAALESDMRGTVDAVRARVSVIRVHDLQLQQGLPPQFLSCASLYATSTLCVVLSWGYTTVFAYEAGRMQSYVEVLVGRLPGAQVVPLPWGIVIITRQ